MGVARFSHQTRVLSIEEVREIFFRRRAFVSLILYIAFLFLMFSSFRHLTASARLLIGEENTRSQLLTLIFEQLYRLGIGSAVEQLLYWPAAVIVFQVLCIFWYPSLISLVSSDMVTTDIHRGTLRFLLLRGSRGAYYWSKLLAHIGLYVFMHIVTLLVLMLVCVWADTGVRPDELVSPGMKYLLVFIPFLFFLVAATQFVSVFCRRPATALLGVHLLWIILLLPVYVAPDFTPFHWRAMLGLVVPIGEYAFDAQVRFVLWGLGFALLGFARFYRREV